MTAPSHSEREHARWAASATSRNWMCAGAIALCDQIEHLDKESEASAWGTACHQVAEKCLKRRLTASHFINTIEKTKTYEILVDDELAETAQVYVDYVIEGSPEAAGSYEREVIIEEKFSLNSLNTPFDAGGTADAIIYYPQLKLLEVIDLKGGRGVKVSAEDNKQLRTYALGAVLHYQSMYKIDKVKATIVQPRVSKEPKSETFYVADLALWTSELLEKMHRAKDACDAYRQITGDISRDEWAEKYLTTGQHCDNTFCSARGICPKREKEAMDAAGFYFDNLDQPQLRNSPKELDPERIAKLLDSADMIEGFLASVRSLARQLVDTGIEIPNYILVDKVGHRKWIDEHKTRTALWGAGLGDDQIYTKPELKSPSQIEKILSSKHKNLLDGLWQSPVTGKNLCRADKTKRKAAKPAVALFDNLKGT